MLVSFETGSIRVSKFNFDGSRPINLISIRFFLALGFYSVCISIDGHSVFLTRRAAFCRILVIIRFPLFHCVWGGLNSEFFVIHCNSHRFVRGMFMRLINVCLLAILHSMFMECDEILHHRRGEREIGEAVLILKSYSNETTAKSCSPLIYGAEGDNKA